MRATARRTFRSLSVRNYRLYLAGMLVSATGNWVQMVAQGWLVLQLTGRGRDVGLLTAAQFLPLLLAGAWGGVLADRFDKRRLLVRSQMAMALVAAALAAVTLAGAVRVWMVFLAAFLIGCANVVDHPTRHSFVSELVGPSHVANAVSLNSAVFNTARLVGPAVAGMVILAGGTGVCFAVNAASYLATIGAVRAMRPGELRPASPVPRAAGQVRAGVRYVLATPELRATILLVAVVGTFAMNFQVVLPLLARFAFDGGPGTFGLLTSCLGLGSVAGALVAAARSRPTPALLVGAAAALGLLMLGVAAAPSLPWAVPALVLTGGASITFLSTANSSLQLGSSQEMRGRVMALYALVFLGSTPIGGPIVGFVAEELGPRAGLALGGGASVIGALASAGGLARARRRRAGAPAPGAPVPEGGPVPEVAAQRA